jgi:hypothetical protein
VIGSKSLAKFSGFFFVWLLYLVALLSLVEVTVRYFMNRPALIPSGILLNAARTLYWKEKALIQFTRDCAQYDAQLTYTLRPGTCTFSGTEFSNTYQINSLGLRDDERSLRSPEIIVIGDSQAMGWGVEQQETFAQIIEARTGVKVLNAAISSYGTAREVMNLKRLKMDRLHFLVIQYHENDLSENQAFYENNNRLKITSRSEYQAITNAHEKLIPYFFGKNLKHIWSITTEIGKDEIDRLATAIAPWLGISHHANAVSRPASSPPELNSAELFLNVLSHSGINFNGIEVIVFEATNWGENTRFLDLLKASLSSKDHIPGSLAIKTIDVAKLLGPQHYYRLDGHLNAAGHRVMADAIIEEMGLLPGATSAEAH